jgi:CheY-like chemotaxis protein
MVRQTVEPDVRRTSLGKPEAPRLALVSRSLLLREALGRRLSLLGMGIASVSDFEALAREIESGSPDLILVDGDGWEQPWEVLLRSGELGAKGIPVLLLIASMDVEQVLQASSLGVAAVILKPFKPEEHTARIFDLCLEAQDLAARRAHPRYVPADGQRLEMEILPEQDWVKCRLSVLEVSSGGARIELPDPPAAAGLVPGSRWAVASLAVGGARTSVTFRVVHRTRNTFGVAFEQVIDRNRAFQEALQDLDRSVFGSLVPRRHW